MSQKLSPGARHLLEQAREAARWYSASRVEVPHLLFALLADSVGGAAGIFRALGVDTAALIGALDLSAGSGARPSARPELGPDVERALEHASDEARLAGSRRILKEHVLAGCLRVEGSPAVAVLARAGVDLETARVQLWKLRSPARDIIDVPKMLERMSREDDPAALAEPPAEGKPGFRKIKVLRAGDINQLIGKVLSESLEKMGRALSEEEERLRAEIEKEFEEQQRRHQELQDLADKNASAKAVVEQRVREIAEAHAALVRKLDEANAQLSGERTRLLEDGRALEQERSEHAAEIRARLESVERARQEAQKREPPPEALPPLACPRGHGLMERVAREGVRLAVCPECLCTAFEPGQLEALVRRLTGLPGEALWKLLDPDEESLERG